MILANSRKIGILHYSAPPVVGGVESVIATHVRLLEEAGYPTTVLAGRGSQEALRRRSQLVQIPELDSQHPEILALSRDLEHGHVPDGFDTMVDRLAATLASALQPIDVLVVHNVFTKHFNLPLTAALVRLLDAGSLPRCIAWCHDITWTSPNSRSKVHEGYPWDLLRTYRPDLTYVAVSQERKRQLTDLLDCAPERIRVIYNGVDGRELLSLSDTGLALSKSLDVWESELNLLMPVRVTQAKNIELAIEVIAALKRQGQQAKLVVTGPPDPHDPKNMEYFSSLLRLRRRLGVEGDMHFLYESGPDLGQPFLVDMSVIADLYRLSDALFMPSHREGFGMPVLEAGLAGLPVFCSDQVPAATEIGKQDLIRFAPNAEPEQIASLILKWMDSNPVFHLRRRVRQHFTWQSIFRGQILPLIDQDGS
jgi:glycosyltransferase involved in cell wall biosynthesis